MYTYMHIHVYDCIYIYIYIRMPVCARHCAMALPVRFWCVTGAPSRAPPSVTMVRPKSVTMVRPLVRPSDFTRLFLL